MAVAHAALDPSADLAVVAHVEVVHSLMAVHAEAVRSLTVVVHTVVEVLTVAVLTDMEAWVAVVKLRVPVHALLHSSCASPRS